MTDDEWAELQIERLVAEIKEHGWSLEHVVALLKKHWGSP